MREFFEAINEYPWTTLLVYVMIISIIKVIQNKD
jgi:hypothetical protein